MGIALIYPAETREHMSHQTGKLENHLLKHIGRVGTCSFPGGYGFQSFLFLFAKWLEGCIAKVANDRSNVKMPLFPPRLPIWTNFWRWRQKQRSGFGHDTVVMVWLINQPHQDVPPPQIRPCERLINHWFPLVRPY